MDKVADQKRRERQTAAVGPRRRSFWSYAAAAVLIWASVTAVLVFWRPAPCGAVPGRFDFVQAVAVSEIASAAVELSLHGYTELGISQRELADIGGATLAAVRALPAPVAEAIRLNLPREIENLQCIQINENDVSFCIRYRRMVPFYVTMRGRLLHRADGGLDFAPSGAKIGLLPLSAGLARRFLHVEDFVLLEPEEAGFRIDEYVQRAGGIELELSELRD